MNTLTIILIALTIVLLIVNILAFTIEHTTTKNEFTFDKSKVKIILLASEDAHKLVESEIELNKKYYVINSSVGSLKTKHGPIFISAYLVESE